MKKRTTCILFVFISLIMFLGFKYQDMIFGKRETVKGLVLLKSNVENYKALQDMVKKEYNIKLKIDYAADELDYNIEDDFWKFINNKLDEKLKNEDIDLLLDIPNEYLTELINNDKLLKLDDYIETENIYTAIIDKSKKIGNGNIYFVSPSFSTNFLMVNKQLAKELDISIPDDISTWSDFEKVLRNSKIKLNDNKINDIYPLAFGINGKESFFQDFEILTRTSKLPIKSDGIIYENEEWNEHFSFFMNLYKNYSIDKEIYTPDLFNDNKILFKITNGTELDLYKDNFEKYEILKVPQFNENADIAYLETSDFSIMKEGKNKDNSLKVLNYLMGKDFAKYSVESTYSIGNKPLVSYIDEDIIDIYNNKYNIKDSKAIYGYKNGYAHNEEFPTFDEYCEFQRINRDIINKIINGSIDIYDGFDEIKKQQNKNN